MVLNVLRKTVIPIQSIIFLLLTEENNPKIIKMLKILTNLFTVVMQLPTSGKVLTNTKSKKEINIRKTKIIEKKR